MGELRPTLFAKIYDAELLNNHFGLYLAAGEIVLLGLFAGRDIIGLVLFDRLLGFERQYTEKDFY